MKKKTRLLLLCLALLLCASSAAFAQTTANQTGQQSHLYCWNASGMTWDKCEVPEDATHGSPSKNSGPQMICHGQLTAPTDVDSLDAAKVRCLLDGTLLVGQYGDPCTYLRPTVVPVSSTSDVALITAVSGKYNFICSGVLNAGTAEIISIWEGTGSACGSSSAAVVGSTTEANGVSLANNGIFQIFKTIPGLATNKDTCLRISGSNRVSGYVTYVQAP